MASLSSSSPSEVFLRINASSKGQEKLFRLVQYLSRFLWGSLSLKGTAKDWENLLKKLRVLEAQMSRLRKGLRLGREVDNILRLSRLQWSHPNWLCLIGNVAEIGYLASDHVSLLHSLDLIQLEDAAVWDRRINFFWTIILLTQIAKDLQALTASTGSEARTELSSSRRRAIHMALVLDLAKNSTDLLIPLASLGVFKLSPRTVGALGTLSSVLGLLPLISNSLKYLS